MVPRDDNNCVPLIPFFFCERKCVMENKKITKRDVDFASWYTDVVRAASLADYSSVKGCIVIEPNGYAIWEKCNQY